MKTILQARFNEQTARNPMLAHSGSATPCGLWPLGSWDLQSTHIGCCTSSPLKSYELGGEGSWPVLSSGFLQTPQTQERWRGPGGPRSSALQPPAPRPQPKARFQAPRARPTPGGGRRGGRRGSGPACERASKELSGAGGRAPVRREHVQFAAHPYYG